MGDFDDLLDRRSRAQHVRHLRDSDDLRAWAESALERLQRERTVVADIDPAQDCALTLAMKMPRHKVGVMLHNAQHNFIASADVCEPVARRDEVDGFGRRSCENYLFCAFGAKEPANRL